MNDEWDTATPAPPARIERGANGARLKTGADHIDNLPPHAAEAEQGVLGCLVLAPMEGIPKARARLTSPEALEFYDLRNREIYLTLCRMYDDRMAGKPICSTEDQDPAKGIDGITLHERLRDNQKLELAGGPDYVSNLEDMTPEAGRLTYYLEIVIEKWLLRQVVQFASVTLEQAHAWPGTVDNLLTRWQRQFDEIARQRVSDDVAPARLKYAGHWGEEVWNEFMGVHAGEERGLPLPIDFKFRVRQQENTLVSGDDGSGKSTFLNYAAVHLAAQGQKVCIASFEMPPHKTLRMLISQLTGTEKFPECSASQQLFAAALAWLNSRFVLYDFLGIGDWREILRTFQYAARKMAINVFILDSVMRIGIPDDDYGTQGLASAQFAQFAQAEKVHLFTVIHENKGSEGGKTRVRGSKLWTANADNVLRIERNVAKRLKMDEIWNEIEAERRHDNDPDFIAEKQQEYAVHRSKWDTKASLMKQREMGTQQNASKYFFFDRHTFQFRDHYEDVTVNWLNRWETRRKQSSEPTPESHEAKT